MSDDRDDILNNFTVEWEFERHIDRVAETYLAIRSFNETCCNAPLGRQQDHACKTAAETLSRVVYFSLFRLIPERYPHVPKKIWRLIHLIIETSMEVVEGFKLPLRSPPFDRKIVEARDLPFGLKDAVLEGKFQQTYEIVFRPEKKRTDSVSQEDEELPALDPDAEITDEELFEIDFPEQKGHFAIRPFFGREIRIFDGLEQLPAISQEHIAIFQKCIRKLLAWQIENPWHLPTEVKKIIDVEEEE